jgi:hypothetical protein
VKPEVTRALDVCAAHLMLEVAPHLAPGYRQASAMVTAIMLTSIREELDRIAERRVVENRALRSLFADASASVADAALRTRLEEAGASEETSHLISALEATNARLRELLIELHAHVESLEGESARRIEAAIWRELAESTERRRLSLAMF